MMMLQGWTIIVSQPIWLALVPVLLGLTYWWNGRAGVPLVASGVVVLAICSALARPALVPLDGRHPPVVLLDRSGSVAEGAADAMVAALGDGALVWPFGDADHTPLVGALQAVENVLPATSRVLIATDGLATDGRPADVASRLHDKGMRVDVLGLSSTQSSGLTDLAVIGIDAPSTWRRGDVGAVAVKLRAASAVTGTLRLEGGARSAQRTPLRLDAGDHVVWLAVTATQSIGPLWLRAIADAEGDQVPGNDAMWRAVHVVPPPRLLVVGEGAPAVGLADRLAAAAGMRSTVVGAARMPSRLSELRDYDAIVVVDQSASALAPDQQAALAAFVADLGGGVLLMGGRSSFALGGWRGSLLESLAPVTMEPASAGRAQSIALLLLIDRSASMGGGDSRTRATKLDLAREAAYLSAEVLGASDQIGIIAYDETAAWLLPLSATDAAGPSGRLVALDLIKPGGGTRILSALALGLPALAAIDASTRHAVLLTDGRDDNEEHDELAAAVAAAAAAGVSVSAIAIGLDTDEAILRRLARLGGGRYHAARDPGDLPRLTAEESAMVQAGAERRGRVRPRPAADAATAALLAGMDAASLPVLDGYQALEPRHSEEGVEHLLEADGDPLLTRWRYGLGHVAAWTSDAGESWAADWRDDPDGAQVWARLLSAIAKEPAGGTVAAHVQYQDGGARVVVDASDTLGRPLNLATATLVVTAAGTTAKHSSAPLPQVAPGRYEMALDLGSPADGPAAWAAAVVLEAPDSDTPIVAPLVFHRGYPLELVPPTNIADPLAELAAAGGGRLLSEPPTLRATSDAIELWPWLVAAAAALWPASVRATMKRPTRVRVAERSRGSTIDPSGADV